MVGKDRDGRAVFRSRPLDARFKNPISEGDERAFQERARYVIEEQAKIDVPAGNTYFENEKRTYGYLMAQVLSRRQGAIQDLQTEDAQAGEWHREDGGDVNGFKILAYSDKRGADALQCVPGPDLRYVGSP